APGDFVGGERDAVEADVRLGAQRPVELLRDDVRVTWLPDGDRSAEAIGDAIAVGRQLRDRLPPLNLIPGDERPQRWRPPVTNANPRRRPAKRLRKRERRRRPEHALATRKRDDAKLRAADEILRR